MSVEKATAGEKVHVVGFNKSESDFIWFCKKAVHDKKSTAYAELFHTLLKMFVDADTNQDGLVSRASFSKLIDMAVVLPRLYGYAPKDEDLYKTPEEKVAARTKMFDSMDTKASGVITFDEWLKFALEHIAGKVAGLDPHPILDHGDKTQFVAFVKKAVTTGTEEHAELYWYLLEMFLEHDTNRDGNVTMGHFVEMVDAALELPIKHKLLPVDLVEFGGDKAEKIKVRTEMFKKYNTRGDGNMTFDEFLACAMEVIFKKIEIIE